MDFVDDVDLEAGVVGAEFGVFADFADGVDAVVAGAVDFEHVHGGAGGDFAAAVAGVAGINGGAGFAIEAFGEDPGGGGFSGAAGADKEVGVGDAVALDGTGQGIGDMGLAHHVGEALGTVFAGDDFVCHKIPCGMNLSASSGDPARARRSTAPGQLVLVLLPSGPDTVRPRPSHRTQPSTPDHRNSRSNHCLSPLAYLEGNGKQGPSF